ncbi:MAG TPA: hypothetical protein VFZ22_12680 [Pyrinomonadaceae bacterium]|nr:hypothetical protein [Pyrinomonadaceae bacterium]
MHRLILIGLVVLTLSGSAFVATRQSSGQSSQTSNPLTMKVLRQKDKVRNSPNSSEVAAFRLALQEEERRLEDTIPKHIPIKIKIKKEKEAAFKDLKNERWARDFELEVTNTGTKPIYALDLYVITDVKAAAGFRIVFPLNYGRVELGDIRTKAEPTDIPIKPGESISLTIHPGQLDAWDIARRKENRPFPKHLLVKFHYLSFGDVTGYWGPDGTALPRKIPDEEGLGVCLPPSHIDIFGWKDAPPGSPLFKLLAFNLPAAFGPVSFWGESDFEVASLSLLPIQTCCSGPGCSSLTPWKGDVCLNCPPQNRPGLGICGDPLSSCFTTVSDYIECTIPKTGESYFCQTIDLFACGASPSPSPSPSASASPTPAPCPLALPSQCPTGVPRDPCTYPDPPPPTGGTETSDGCPFNYQVSGACCVPIPCPQPTPTPPACENGFLVFNPSPNCNWSCLQPLSEPPLPSPTPEQAEEYKQECIDYYWVWFVSYDGGKTWQPTGRVEYMGCLIAM